MSYKVSRQEGTILALERAAWHFESSSLGASWKNPFPVAILSAPQALLSSWDFDAKYIMLAGQVGVGLAFTVFAQRFLQDVPGLKIPPFNWNVYVKSIPVGVLFVLNIACGWYGMKLISVPMFLCLRRTTTILTMTAEYFLLGTKQSGLVVGTVLIIMLGTILAGYEDLNSDLTGYLFTFGNNVLTALYLAVSRKFSDETGTKGFGLVYYNSITSLPLSILAAMVLGEFEYLSTYQYAADPRFLAAIVVASLLGTFMTYVVFLSATLNSPLLTSITGNMKDVFATFIGAYMFSDFEPTFLKVLGLVVSMAGGGSFAFAKLQERGHTKQAPAKQIESSRGTLGSGASAPNLSDSKLDMRDQGHELAPLKS